MKKALFLSLQLALFPSSVCQPTFSCVICIPGHSSRPSPSLAFQPRPLPGLQTCLTNGLLDVLQVPFYLLFSKDPLFFHSVNDANIFPLIKPETWASFLMSSSYTSTSINSKNLAVFLLEVSLKYIYFLPSNDCAELFLA